MNTVLEEPPVDTTPVELPVEAPPARSPAPKVQLPAVLPDTDPRKDLEILRQAMKGFLIAVVVLVLLGAAVIGLLSSVVTC